MKQTVGYRTELSLPTGKYVTPSSSYVTIPARPDSAPTLHRRFPRDAGHSSRERLRSKQLHASAWLPPRVTRLERETHDLLTACRKAGRDKGDAMRWCHESFRHGRRSEEPPQHRGGDSRRKSERSNTCDPFWSGKAITVALTVVNLKVFSVPALAVCIALTSISIQSFPNKGHALHRTMFSGETRVKDWTLDPHGKANGS